MSANKARLNFTIQIDLKSRKSPKQIFKLGKSDIRYVDDSGELPDRFVGLETDMTRPEPNSRLKTVRKRSEINTQWRISKKPLPTKHVKSESENIKH